MGAHQGAIPVVRAWYFSPVSFTEHCSVLWVQDPRTPSPATSQGFGSRDAGGKGGGGRIGPLLVLLLDDVHVHMSLCGFVGLQSGRQAERRHEHCQPLATSMSQIAGSRMLLRGAPAFPRLSVQSVLGRQEAMVSTGPRGNPPVSTSSREAPCGRNVGWNCCAWDLGPKGLVVQDW